ncbi:Fe(3+)-hydroxamate ABC transporter permease FhuB [Aurantimonas sp. HBX-1]|uniref:Fe(3+)-hydroxamate ABC transporter permease FhuB n=1 Tax=Aurantimonas sp. HBX-1 TaxID=2906072 RepID=UPI001F369ACE|nr:Fe(3+)-hydroxamate ABC transporter permease FhuB [Aurantimonas sp. HBX-1]UIJ74272.1 Fe(3+)-hydroxamate ABC transporter permease FhuB [Aurantimonas sp. HBX-1]
MALLALGLGAVFLGPSLPVLWRGKLAGYDAERMVLVYATLPRLAMAVLCGAALGASGALLQQALRNPLASPTTLGIDAGARLALVIVTLFFPALFGWGRDVVALAGSGLAAALVFALSRRQDYSPVSLILSGLLVSLYCGALAASLTLVESRYLASLFVWGAGSLSQQSWDPATDLALRLAIVAPFALLIVRPLAVLDLGEAAARGLGLDVSTLRLAAVGLAVLLAAFVTSAVGSIGFIGLVAPILVRLAGARSFASRFAGATAVGALLLLVTDLVVQLLAGAAADFLPTGAVTALLGSPILLWLLPRVTARMRRVEAMASPRARRSIAGSVYVAPLVLAASLLALVLVALFVGRTPSGGWEILSSTAMADILPFRWPRVLAMATAGLLLGTAGFLLQRLSGNEMASPEILGVSAGATFAMAIALFAGLAQTALGATVAATIGAGLVLTLILLLARRSGFQPERMLLAGIALAALLDAVIGVLSAAGDPRAFQLLSWMTGAAQTVAPASAIASFALAGLGLVTGLGFMRWLAVLPLGPAAALGLGVPLATARALLLVLAAVTTAVATPLAGPLTFVGLIAPHLVRFLGVRPAGSGLVLSALAGAAILVVADWLARSIAFPFQLPTGLVASLVGAPILLWLLQRRNA